MGKYNDGWREYSEFVEHMVNAVIGDKLHGSLNIHMISPFVLESFAFCFFHLGKSRVKQLGRKLLTTCDVS